MVFSSLLIGKNQYPIVLIHGFLGWGPEELGGYRYWGGFHDIEADLKDAGFTVYTVSVGPVSSNWERAVEAYYQIKGGQVDYGLKHSRQWGVIQKPEGKTYAGLYPAWDANHPIHIIGHSMGGQTARMLLYLLNGVFYGDSGDTIPEASGLLGKAKPNWIKSITTISTPHNGTTLSNIVIRSAPFLQNFIALAAVVGTDFYDFDLQQWGFHRQPDETWMSYYKRMQDHPAWNTKNISAWDLDINGARELNTMLQSDRRVYYFSFVTSATHRDSATGYHVPDNDMSLILQARARRIGKDAAYWTDGSSTDSSWYENDGVVNTCSQKGPTSGANGADPIAEFHANEPLIPGQWYVMPLLKMDHWQVVGHTGIKNGEYQTIKQLYLNQAALLSRLPN